jgi:hypothetical protein
MRLSFFNRNYFGTHFGGSLYAMCDPFFVLILAERLGSGYIVWDKAATIHFKQPGRGTVRARFEIAAERMEEIRHEADEQGKSQPMFIADVVDQTGAIVATVEKVISVRRNEIGRHERFATPAGG